MTQRNLFTQNLQLGNAKNWNLLQAKASSQDSNFHGNTILHPDHQSPKRRSNLIPYEHTQEHMKGAFQDYTDPHGNTAQELPTIIQKISKFHLKFEFSSTNQFILKDTFLNGRHSRNLSPKHCPGLFPAECWPETHYLPLLPWMGTSSFGTALVQLSYAKHA